MRFFFDSDFRDKYIHDLNFWFIIIGLSYLLIILLARNWSIKNFKILLWTAIGLCLTGNIFGFVFFYKETSLGAFNGPLVTLIIYRLLYDWFSKKYNKPPAAPLNTFYSNDKTLMKDGLLNALFVFVSICLTALLAGLTKW